MKKQHPKEQEFITAFILCLIIGIISLYIFGKSAVWFFILLIICELFHFRGEFKSVLLKCILKIKNRNTHNKENSEAQFSSQEIEQVKQETEQTAKAYYEKMLELEVNKAKEETKQALESEYQEKLKKASSSSTDKANNIKNAETEEKHINVLIDTDKTSKLENIMVEVNSTKLTNISKQTIEKLKGCYISLDFETTGLSSFNDRIVEIGAVKFINGQPKDEFNTLVHSDVPISPQASRINGITNEMLKNAPNENEALNSFAEFLGDALNGEIILCAHNADFDLRFLISALERSFINASLIYIDTLNLSRTTIKGLENYKLNTVLSHFNLLNNNTHRASSDALACGQILFNLLPDLEKQADQQAKSDEKKKITDEEMEICSYIKSLLSQNCSDDLRYLRCFKLNNGYIYISCLYTFIKFKVAKKGTYIIIDNSIAKNKQINKAPCTKSEGIENTRCFIGDLSQLDIFAPYFCKEYRKALREAKSYMNNSKYCYKKAINIIESQNWIS